MDVNLHRLRYLNDIMPSNVVTLMSDPHTLREKIMEADLLIGAAVVGLAHPTANSFNQ